MKRCAQSLAFVYRMTRRHEAFEILVFNVSHRSFERVRRLVATK
jgi:hypothetical protein